MKLIIILLTVGFLNISAKVLPQNINFSGKNVPLESVFASVKKQTGYLFLYDKSILESSRPVSITVRDIPVKKFLEELFKSQPFLEYSIDGKNIIVSVKPTSSRQSDRTSSVLKDTLIKVNGRVTDERGQPIREVNVIIKGTNKGSVTDANGIFTINANTGDILVISFIGYTTKEIKLVAGNTNPEIILEQKTSKLDEIQIIAYGTTSKRLSTGNISSVKATDIAKQPVSNPLLALQGRVPGIYIVQQNGLPGARINIRIQGQNSIGNGNEPFYVIDGVPYSAEMFMTDASRHGGLNPLYFLNPGNIESIEILKDADATSIYGSRAANGAILITTKKGAAGKTTVDINLQSGWSKVPVKLDLLNTNQYLEARREAKQNDNDFNYTTDYDINGTWDTTRYTDWQKLLVGNTAHYNNLQGSISGGNKETQFLLGGGYIRETTVFIGSEDQPSIKASANFNINHTSSNKRLRLQFSGTYLSSTTRLPARDLMASALSLPPHAPELMDAEGNLNWESLPDGTTTFQNPLTALKTTYRNNITNMIGNVLLSYSLLPYLDIKTSAGYTSLTGNEEVLTPITTYAPDLVSRIRRANISTNSNTSWIIEPQLQFKKKIDIGHIEVLLGSTFQENKRKALGVAGTDFTTDAQLTNIALAPTVKISNNQESQYKYNAIFGRATYNYMDKYIVNFTARRDGSARFGSENLFNNFASVAAAWVFSNEEFVKQHVPALNFGKLRISYGTTGNDQIGDYQFLSLYDVALSGSGFVPYQGIIGLAPQGHANPYLQWEETKKLNIGVDLGFFNNRILLNANYYRNRSSNQLLSYSLPIQTGFGGVTTNFPALVQNTGVELELSGDIITNKRITWNSSLNITIPKNKLVAFPGLESNASYVNRLIVGQPITVIKAYQYADVDPSTGLYRFVTREGDLTSSPNSLTDRTKIFNTSPVFYGGLSNGLKIGNVGIDIFLQFVKQTQLAAANRFGLSSLGFIYMNNFPDVFANRWQQPGDIVNRQRAATSNNSQAATSFNAARESDEAYADASFVRIKNVSFSYHLPHALLSNLSIYQARLYVQGQNLYTFTKYPDLDPESASSSSLPPLRTISVGIQVTF